MQLALNGVDLIDKCNRSVNVIVCSTHPLLGRCNAQGLPCHRPIRNFRLLLSFPPSPPCQMNSRADHPCWVGQQARSARHKQGRLLKIYIYSLPASLQNCTDEAEMWQHHLYGGEIKLPRLIAASAHVTKDPEEADYFYVPTVFFCRGRTHCPAHDGSSITQPSTKHC
jgi:hypothetical protein